MAEDVELRIRALVQGAQDVERLAREVSGLTGAAQRDPTSRLQQGLRNTGRIAGRVRQELFGLQGALAALGVGAVLRGIISLNDEFTQLRGRLALVTETQQERLRVERELFDLAQQTRGSLRDTVDLYARVARNAEGLGASQQQLLEVTRATNQAIQISGATGAEASAGVVQFAQALASGELRGDELRSVLEQLPRLAQAIADGLGITIGELREFAEAGELTADRVFLALLSQQDRLQEEFRALPRTVSQAMTQLRNDVQFALRDADLSPITDSIDDLRDTLTDPATLQGIQTFAAALITAFGAVLRAVDLVVDSTQFLARLYARFSTDNNIEQLRAELDRARTEARTAPAGTPLAQNARSRVERLEQELAAEERLLESMREVEREIQQGRDRRDAGPSAGERVRQASEIADRALNPPERLGGAGNAEAEEERQQRIREITEALREQRDTYGLTAEQVAIYRLQTLGASEAQLEQARSIAQGLDVLEASATAQEALADAERRQAEARRQRAASDRELIASLEEEIELIGLSRRERAQELAVRELSADATDRQREAVRRLAGSLHDLEEAQDQATSQMAEFAEQAARNAQDALADFLFDPFAQGTEEMVSGFAAAMRRIAAEAAAAELLQATVSAASSLIPGGGGAVFQGVRAAIQHTGGVAGAPGAPTRNVPAFIFAGAPRFHQGKNPFLRANEMAAIIERDEEILPTTDPRHIANLAGGGRETGITVVQNISTPDAQSFRQSRAALQRDARLALRGR